MKSIFRQWYWRFCGGIAVGYIGACIFVAFTFILEFLRPGFATNFIIYVLYMPVLGIPSTMMGILAFMWLNRRFAFSDNETRCRKCGYILKGITEPRCSECGERI